MRGIFRSGAGRVVTVVARVAIVVGVAAFVAGSRFLGGSPARWEPAGAVPPAAVTSIAASAPTGDVAAHAEIALPAVLPSGLVFHTDPADGFALLRTNVVADDEFVDRFGAGWQSRLGAMFGRTNELLAEVGIQLEVVSMTRWESDDSIGRLGPLLTSADAATARVPGNLLLVITYQDTVKLDGLARDSAGALIVRYYHEPILRDADLVAHELGHLLGAKHHADEAECDGDTGHCLMHRSGFTGHEDWCSHHQHEIRAIVSAATA